MSVKIFLDTNVLVYTYSVSEVSKREQSQKIIKLNNTIISTQVVQELVNVIVRKLSFSFEQTSAVIEECCKNNRVHINSPTTLLKACTIAAKYKFSFYDSIIVAAALESGCQVLYSEDLQSGQMIEGTLEVRNPFK